MKAAGPRSRPRRRYVEGIAAVDRYDVHNEEPGNEGLLQAAIKAVTTNNRSILGFRYKETHLPLDAEIYVLGVAGKDRCIGAPEPGAKGQRFLISVNSEEARAASSATRADGCSGLASSV